MWLGLGKDPNHFRSPDAILDKRHALRGPGLVALKGLAIPSSRIGGSAVLSAANIHVIARPGIGFRFDLRRTSASRKWLLDGATAVYLTPQLRLVQPLIHVGAALVPQPRKKPKWMLISPTGSR